MSEKSDTKEIEKETPTGSKKTTAVDLLLGAAEMLEKQKGPRAEKAYRSLAEEVRRLADRAAELG